MNVIELLRAHLKAKEQERERRFWRLARRLAEGEELAPEVVEQELESLNRNVLELNAAIELAERLQELRALVAEIPQLKQRYTELQAKERELQDKLERIKRELEKELREVRAEMISVSSRYDQAMRAREELLARCPEQSLVEKRKELKDRENSLYLRRDQIDREIQEIETKLATWKGALAQADNPSFVVPSAGVIKGKISELEGRLQNLLSQRKEVFRELEELQKEIADLEQKMIDF